MIAFIYKEGKICCIYVRLSLNSHHKRALSLYVCFSPNQSGSHFGLNKPTCGTAQHESISSYYPSNTTLCSQLESSSVLSAKFIPECTSLFKTTDALASFFSHSTRRLQFLDKIVQKRKTKAAPTRLGFKLKANWVEKRHPP